MINLAVDLTNIHSINNKADLFAIMKRQDLKQYFKAHQVGD